MLAVLRLRRLLKLFTWMELEILVCGRPEIDIEVLRNHTEYRGFRRTDPTIRYFWYACRAQRMRQRSNRPPPLYSPSPAWATTDMNVHRLPAPLGLPTLHSPRVHAACMQAGAAVVR